MPPLDKEQEDILKALDRGEDNISIEGFPAVGKTRITTGFPIFLLNSGFQMDEILNTTYTRSGTQVMLDRYYGKNALLPEGMAIETRTLQSHGWYHSELGLEMFKKTRDFNWLNTPRMGDEKKWKWIVCDEGQDLTRRQYEKLLSIGEHILLVGDEWQSMFTWAGADPSILDDFREKHCQGKDYALKTNYRSSSSIVEIGNLFSNRKAIWGGQGEKGLVQISDKEPPGLDNITILFRSTKEVESFSAKLRERKISHTKERFSKTHGREAYNYIKGEPSIATLKDYQPTLLKTIFLAKGEEWDRIWLCYRDDDTTYTDAELEERVFYVGLTRAKRELYIHPQTEFIRRLD